MSTAVSTRRSRAIGARRSATARDHAFPSLTPSALRTRAKAASTPWLVAGNEGQDVLRRGLNVLVAVIGILLTAPLMLLIAAAIKLTSRGPVIFTQPRVGVDRRLDRGPDSMNHRRKTDQGGRIFTIYKFRTMKAQADSAQQVWASRLDPRVTRVGRFLRATRLDELPQLFNVLQGDMNIVGPRPEQPEIFDDLRKEVDSYRDRQRVLPGITGLAQVTLPYDGTIGDVRKKVRLDLDYIQRRSASHDLLIMAKTMPVMVMRKGAL